MEENKVVGTADLVKTFNWSPTNPRFAEPSAALYENGYVGGNKPLASNVNYIYKEFGEKLNHILQNGIPKWVSTKEYVVGDIVNHSGRIYQSLNTNTNSTPTTVNANWTYVSNNADLQVALDNITALESDVTLLQGTVATNTTKVATLETIGVPRGYINTPVPQYATARTVTVNGDAVARSGDGLYNILATGNHTVSLDTTGIDGLATGSVASNTWYYLYLVSQADGTGGGYLWDTAQNVNSHSLGATNRLLWSEDLSQSAWVKNGTPQATVLTNVSLSPFGALTADRLVDSTDTAGSGIQQNFTAGSTTSTLSVFLKRGNTDRVRLIFAQGSNQIRQVINLATGTLEAQDTANTAPTNISIGIQDFGAGWYRVRITGTFLSTSLTMVLCTASTNSTIASRVSGGTVDFFGAQANNGVTPDAYTKSEGSIVTGTTTFRSRQLPLAVRTDTSSNILPFYLTTWQGRSSSTRYATQLKGETSGLTGSPTVIGLISSATYSAFSLASFVPPPSRVATLFAYARGGGSVLFRTTGDTNEYSYDLAGGVQSRELTIRTNSSQSIDARVTINGCDIAVTGYTINL